MDLVTNPFSSPLSDSGRKDFSDLFLLSRLIHKNGYRTTDEGLIVYCGHLLKQGFLRVHAWPEENNSRAGQSQNHMIDVILHFAANKNSQGQRLGGCEYTDNPGSLCSNNT